MWVKICGIKTEEDLRDAAGADALGFISGTTHISPDALCWEEARDLITAARGVERVLVTHLRGAKDLWSLWEKTGADILQIHSPADPQTLRDLRGLPIIQVLHIDGPESTPGEIEGVPLLLDSRSPGRLGGTGRVHDWSVSREIVRHYAGPVILAGGLAPHNIESAITTVQPWGVDSNSGTDDDSGGKAGELCKEFVSKAKAYGAGPARLYG